MRGNKVVYTCPRCGFRHFEEGARSDRCLRCGKPRVRKALKGENEGNEKS